MGMFMTVIVTPSGSGAYPSFVIFIVYALSLVTSGAVNVASPLASVVPVPIPLMVIVAPSTAVVVPY